MLHENNTQAYDLIAKYPAENPVINNLTYYKLNFDYINKSIYQTIKNKKLKQQGILKDLKFIESTLLMAS